MELVRCVCNRFPRPVSSVLFLFSFNRRSLLLFLQAKTSPLLSRRAGMASPPRSSSSPPPKQPNDGHKLVNRLGLGTLSLRPRWRVMVLGHQSVGKSGKFPKKMQSHEKRRPLCPPFNSLQLHNIPCGFALLSFAN